MTEAFARMVESGASLVKATTYTNRQRVKLGDGSYTGNIIDNSNPLASAVLWHILVDDGSQTVREKGFAILSPGLEHLYANLPALDGTNIWIGYPPGQAIYYVEREDAVGSAQQFGVKPLASQALDAAGQPSVTQVSTLKLQLPDSDNPSFVVTAGRSNEIFSYPASITLAETQFTSGTDDLTSAQSALTTGQHTISLVCLDMATNGLAALTLSAVAAAAALPSRTEFTAADFATFDLLNHPTYMPIQIVYLYFGQSGILNNDYIGPEVRTFFPPVSAYLALKHNWGASAAPVVGNDNTQGYSIGSKWYDTTHNKIYECISSATGAAVWVDEDGGSAGSVTSVALTVPTDVLTVSGSPITTSGTFAVTKANETANTVAAGPTTGSPAAWAFRALVAADIPSLLAAKISDFSTAVNTLIASAVGVTVQAYSALLTSLATLLPTSGPGVLVQATNGAVVTVPTVLDASYVLTTLRPLAKGISTSNISISSAPSTLDNGVPFNSGDLGLLVAQSTGSQNGPWVSAGAGNPLVRPSWYASGSTVYATRGIVVWVINPGNIYWLTTTGTITIDTTATSWSTLSLNASQLAFGIAGASVGGTGLASPTPHSLLVTNSNNPMNLLAPGANHNVVVSNSTDFVSQALTNSELPTVNTAHGGTGVDLSASGGPTMVLAEDGSHVVSARNLVTADIPGLPGSIITSGTVPAANLGGMTGDAGSGGAKGAAPAPATGDAVHGLFGDATWAGTARKLVDLTVLGASAANIDLTSIPATYKHLMIELELRSDRAANTTDNAYIRLNNDSTAADYYSYSIAMNGTTPTFSILERLAATATGIECNLSTTAATAPANEYGYFQIWIYNYASVANNRKVEIKTLNRTGTATGNLRHIITAGWWLNTAAAVSRITILPVNGSNWVSGSSYMLYGFS